MNFIRLFLVALFFIQPLFTLAKDGDIKDKEKPCLENIAKKTLLNGWYLWEPYQFNKITAGGYSLTGMDIQLVQKLAERTGVETKYEQVEWEQHQLDLKEGRRDIAAGATYTKARADYAYFSVPYRFEENSLFILHETNKNLDFKSISEFMAQVRLQNFKLGITEGFIYADPQINLFISDNSNQDIIYKFPNDVEALRALVDGEVDGFIADRVVGAAAILNHKATTMVKEIQLHVKTPIHLMFSKETVPLELVDKFNQEIKDFSVSDEYKNIVKTYLYPVMLLQTIDSKWFYFGYISIIHRKVYIDYEYASI